MRPCRILMTVDAVGGVWQYACELSAALRPFGVESVLALLGPAPSSAQRQDLGEAIPLIETGFDLDWLARDAAAVEAAGSAIASLGESLGVDLVHLNQAALASASFVMPVVATIHSCVATWWQAVHGGDAPSSFAWQTELLSHGLRRSDAIVAPSVAFADTVRRTYALRDLPHVVPNGRRPLVASQIAPEDSVFTAARLWDQGKNVATLDRVASRLAHPFRAAGATHGPQGEGIALHHIERLGSLDAPALAKCLEIRPVFVSAAHYEPFGLAVLEAASAGCALVLADIPTFREIWDRAAIFVAPTDEDGFVAAIKMLLRDGQMRLLQGDHARDRAAQFTPSRMAAGMYAIYAQALAKRDAAAQIAAA